MLFQRMAAHPSSREVIAVKVLEQSAVAAGVVVQLDELMNNGIVVSCQTGEVDNVEQPAIVLASPSICTIAGIGDG